MASVSPAFSIAHLGSSRERAIHASFDAVGIPAFQLMQDRLEYNSRTHHSNMDTVDRVQRDDVVQMAVVVAALAYDTAMRPEKLPRKVAASSQPGGR